MHELGCIVICEFNVSHMEVLACKLWELFGRLEDQRVSQWAAAGDAREPIRARGGSPTTQWCPHCCSCLSLVFHEPGFISLLQLCLYSLTAPLTSPLLPRPLHEASWISTSKWFYSQKENPALDSESGGSYPHNTAFWGCISILRGVVSKPQDSIYRPTKHFVMIPCL